jgi:hypothetical protein
MKMIVQRLRNTDDGIIGTVVIPDFLEEFTIENLEKSIPAGLYNVVIDRSPRLHIYTPHIRVPTRDASGDAGIRIHPANWPKQLEGCISVGLKAEADAVDNSKKAFENLMDVIAKKAGFDTDGIEKFVAIEALQVEIRDIPAQIPAE